VELAVSRILDGTDDHGTVPGAGTLHTPTSALTVAVWTKHTTAGQWSTIINKQQGGGFNSTYAVYQPGSTARTYEALSHNSSVGTSVTGQVAADVWLLMVIRWSSGGPVVLRFYDTAGTVVASATSANVSTALSYTANNPLYFGSYAGVDHWPGKLGRSAIYPTALSDAELVTLAEGGDILALSPVAAWSLTTSGTTEPDLTGNGNTLTWTGATFDSSDDPPLGGGSEDYVGGSTTVVNAIAIGEGTKQAIGGSITDVEVTTVGQGFNPENVVEGALLLTTNQPLELTDGSFLILAEYEPSEEDHFFGGNTTNVEVTALSSGVKHAVGGSVVSCEASVQGSGVKGVIDGSTIEVEVTTQGSGTKQESTVGGGGSTTSITVDTVGAGYKGTIGASVEEVIVSTMGQGVKGIVDSSVVHTATETIGQGYKSTVSASDVDVVVTTQGSGTKLEYTTGGGGSTTSIVVETVGSGFKGSVGGDTTTVAVDLDGEGYKWVSGSSTTIVRALAVGIGFNPDAALAHRNITFELRSVVIKWVFSDVRQKTIVYDAVLSNSIVVKEVTRKLLQFKDTSVTIEIAGVRRKIHPIIIEPVLKTTIKPVRL
jgi:hypothetical protein